ncbi:MAG: PAS domain S-box protein [Candidatus Marinimicrobia bacterium]|nr:PAS domain S-box protein [Candidatus Neomarinimicrobiota bacterium]MCF7880263.1 PAS domain S-box protein [Candidatus Neomarinimicrobiota bacterium]
MGFTPQVDLVTSILDLHDSVEHVPGALSSLTGESVFRKSIIYWTDLKGHYRLILPENENLPSEIDPKIVGKIKNGASWKESEQDFVVSLEELFQKEIQAIPLIHRNDCRGIWLYPAPQNLSRKAIQKIAKFLSIGLEHRQNLLESERQNKRLHSLVEAGEIFTSQTNLNAVLKKLVQELYHRFKYSRVAVLIKEDTQLKIAAAEGFSQNHLIGYTFDINKGITGRAVREMKSQNVEDVLEDEDFLPAGEDDIRSEMTVPIHLDGEVLGVLDAQSTVTGAFDESDVNFLHVIARLSAVAIQNGRLIEDLQSTKNYLDSIVDSSGDAIFAINTQGKITTWNIGAERIYGYSREEALGQQVDDLVDPEDHKRTTEEVLQLVKENNGIYHEDEIIRRRKSGETFPATPTYTLLRDDSGIIGISIIEKDLTYIKQATKLDSAKTLISTVTHYINNAITPLNGRAQIAQMQRTEDNVDTLIQVSLETTQKIQEVISTISEMKEFIATPYYNTSYIINLEEQLKQKLSDLKGK